MKSVTTPLDAALLHLHLKDAEKLHVLIPGVSKQRWLEALRMNGGIPSLFRGSVEDWTLTFGSAAAKKLAALREVAVRREAPTSPRFNSPEVSYAAFQPFLAGQPKETFMAAALSSQLQLLKLYVVAVGQEAQCTVPPADVFTPAILARAMHLVLAHNHPAGDPEPSISDVTLTRRLCEGAKCLGLRIADHIIIGDGRYVSMYQRGMLATRSAFEAPLAAEKV